jgi:hypothetical protein
MYRLPLDLVGRPSHKIKLNPIDTQILSHSTDSPGCTRRDTVEHRRSQIRRRSLCCRRERVDHRRQFRAPRVPKPEDEGGDRGEGMAVDLSKINSPTRAAARAEHVEPRRPRDLQDVVRVVPRRWGIIEDDGAADRPQHRRRKVRSTTFGRSRTEQEGPHAARVSNSAR